MNESVDVENSSESNKILLKKRDWIAGLEKGLSLIEAFDETHSKLPNVVA